MGIGGVDKNHRGVRMHFLGSFVKILVLMRITCFKLKRYI